MSPRLDPAHPAAPKYWRNETGDELKPAVFAYIRGQPLTVRQIALISAYVTQWIASPVWDANPALDERSRNMLFALR